MTMQLIGGGGPRTQKSPCPSGFKLHCPPPGGKIAPCKCVKTSPVMHGYDPLTYPDGVPNPYVATVEPYPSYVHGADYTRPQFAMPYVSAPHNVLRGVGSFMLPETAADRRNRGIVASAGFMAAVTGLLAIVSAPPGRRTNVTIGAFVVGGVLGAVAGGIAAAFAQGEIM